MLIRLYASVMLILREVDGTGFGFLPTAQEWKIGVRYFVYFLPVGAAIMFGLGLIRFKTFPTPLAAAPLTFLGVLWVLALGEEFLARGLLQQWISDWTGRPSLGLAFASIAFGLSHLWFRGFPNWRWVILTTALGWFCGKAYNEAGGIRVYSEMASILWKAHRFAAAVHLEQFWNKLMARATFSLFCGYSMDVFDPDLHIAELDDVLCAHSHLVPSAPNGILKSALWRAMDEVLGEKSHEIRNLSLASGHASWVVLPEEEAMVLWLTKHLPDQVQTVLKRARHHYEKLAAVAA